MPTTRIERDSFGEIEVPAERLWGAQTQRSLEHFRISSERFPPSFIRALAEVKRAAHYVTRRRGGEGAVREACELLIGLRTGGPRKAAR